MQGGRQRGVAIAAALGTLAAAALAAPVTASAATITVNTGTDTVADNSTCSFREAIVASNTNAPSGVAPGECAAGSAAPATDTIEFFAGMTIFPLSPLPALTEPVTLDSRAGAGCSGARQITLDGSAAGAGANGLQLGAGSDGSTVCGFAIGTFGGSGIQVDSAGNTIIGNRIGIGLGSPPTLMPNGEGVFLNGDAADDNVIGGTDVASGRNVISGNDSVGPPTAGAGVRIAGGDSNSVLGNFLGTAPTGDTATANDYGIYVGEGSQDNAIGGAAAGERNLISGNRIVGVLLGEAATTTGNRVEGNYIGTDVAGNAAVPNGQEGVRIVNGASANVIGGTSAGEGNLISGNTQNGVQIIEADGNDVFGNFIGTNAAGTASLGNGTSGSGVQLSTIGAAGGSNEVGAPDTSIDATGGGARNLISGHAGAGVRIIGANGTGDTVEGNFIGTDAAGTAAISNGTNALVGGGGVVIETGGTGVRVGGTAAGAANVISGNDQAGVYVDSSAGTGNTIEGNLIGPDGTGGAPLGNELGVLLNGDGVTVGGDAAGEGNTIAHNVEEGVLVDGAGSTDILRNSIFDNGFLGIDLEFGANGGFSPPDLTGAQANSVDTTVQGTLETLPAEEIRVEFFSSPACDGSGAGEGQTFLGATEVTTDGAGAASVDATLAPTAVGAVVTATLTRESPGGTSEFSTCQAVVAKAEPPPPPPPDPDPGTGGNGADGGTGGTGGGAGGGGSGGGGNPADTKAPLLDVGGETKQDSKKKVKVEVSCDEECTVDGEGTIKVPEKYKDGEVKSKEKFDLKDAEEVELEAGETAKLKLEFRNKAADLVEKALKKKEKSTAKVTASATDTAGNETVAEKFEIKVK